MCILAASESGISDPTQIVTSSQFNPLMKNKFNILAMATAAAFANSANAAVMNYVVTGYANGSSAIMEGTNSDIPGGGSLTQTAVSTVGDFVDFTIGDADAIVGDKFLAANINALPTVATLRVTLAAISGGTELLLARTSNSQGLMDVGTVTVLLANTTPSTPNNATFTFSWRNAANTASLSGDEQMVFTSYDIDFTQRNTVSASDYSVIGFNPVTNLTNTTNLGITNVTDPAPGTTSTVDQPENAYAFITVEGDFEQSISVDKVGGGGPGGFTLDGNQLYMFSFRSPSPLVEAIPEPSTALLGGLGLLALLRRRR